MTSGLVIKQEANFFSVAYQDQTYLCTVRANLRKAGRGIKVGDRVILDHLEEERPVIRELLPRSSDLEKPAVANVDQVIPGDHWQAVAGIIRYILDTGRNIRATLPEGSTLREED